MNLKKEVYIIYSWQSISWPESKRFVSIRYCVRWKRSRKNGKHKICSPVFSWHVWIWRWYWQADCARYEHSKHLSFYFTWLQVLCVLLFVFRSRIVKDKILVFLCASNFQHYLNFMFIFVFLLTFSNYLVIIFLSGNSFYNI